MLLFNHQAVSACDPWTAAQHILRCLLKFAQIHVH